MIVFILGGTINNLQSVVNRFKEAGKLILIHFDLVNGLARDVSAFEFITDFIQPDGIMTTRSNIIAAAKQKGIFAKQRVFLLDSMAYESSLQSIRSTKPNAIEIIPGALPKVIAQMNKQIKIPIIAGGLILDKEDILQALDAGALGISTSKPEIWEM